METLVFAQTIRDARPRSELISMLYFLRQQLL